MLDRVLIALLGWRSPEWAMRKRKSHSLLDVPRPFPNRLLGRKPVGAHNSFGLGPWSLRVNQDNITWRNRVYSSWPFVRVGFWREWYFPSMLEVWRKGDDIRVRFWPAFKLRRWLFTRCEGCGRRGPYGGSPVYQYGHDARTKSILLGETGCYFHGCTMDPAVDYSNTLSWDNQWGHDDGLRRHVLNEPIDVALELSMLAKERRKADTRYRRRLLETRREHGMETFAWRFPKQTDDEEIEAR